MIDMLEPKQKRLQLGPVARKVLVLLGAGVALALTRRPDKYFRIINAAAKEWEGINRRSFYDAVRDLYRSKLVGCKEKRDGTITIELASGGRKIALTYNLQHMRLQKPESWDGWWRMIISDIPEYKKKARNAFASTLKRIGCHPLQKSVYIYPHDCKKEIDFIIELFDLRPFVRFILAKETDVDLQLKKKFDL